MSILTKNILAKISKSSTANVQQESSHLHEVKKKNFQKNVIKIFFNEGLKFYSQMRATFR